MKNDIIEAGTTVPIDIFLYNGAIALTGESVVIVIERISDNYFWNGSAFASGYTTVAMSDLSVDIASNDHYDGLYRYSWAHPVADGADVYDWSVVHSLGAGRTVQHRGRIRTIL